MLKNIFKKRKSTELSCEILSEKDMNVVTAILTNLNLSGNTLKLYINEETIKNHFELGDIVNVKLLKDGKEFVFFGNVTSKTTSSFEQALIVNINELRVFSNLRKNERFSYKCTATIRDCNGEAIESTLKDIGIGGALITTESKISSNDEINVEIISLDNEKINFEAEIIRETQLQGSFSYAVKIKHIDDENSIILNKLLTFLSFQKSRLVDEWKNVKSTSIKASLIMTRMKM